MYDLYDQATSTADYDHREQGPGICAPAARSPEPGLLVLRIDGVTEFRSEAIALSSVLALSVRPVPWQAAFWGASRRAYHSGIPYPVRKHIATRNQDRAIRCGPSPTGTTYPGSHTLGHRMAYDQDPQYPPCRSRTLDREGKSRTDTYPRAYW